MARKLYRYPRESRLTRESDLELVKRAGRRLRTEYLDVRAADSLLSHARTAVIVGKYGHTIVERNQLRRRLRELVRTVIAPGIESMDVVIRASSTAYAATFEQLVKDVGRVARWLSSGKEMK